MYAANLEEPRRKRRGFFVGMEYGNRIVRPTQLCCVPAAIKSGDCGEHPFKEKGLNDEYSKSRYDQTPFNYRERNYSLAEKDRFYRRQTKRQSYSF